MKSPRESLNSELSWVTQEPLRQLREQKLKRLVEGRPVLDLAMFNPDIAPPRLLLDKLSESSVKPVSHRYAASRGIRKLREAFAVKYAKKFDVKLDPESEVCVTLATKDAVHHTLLALGKSGDTVLMAEPGYPAHAAAARLLGMRVGTFLIGTTEAETISAFREAFSRLSPRVVLLNFPHNPLGICISAPSVKLICEEVSAAGAWVLNDFVYGEMGYDEVPTSFLKFGLDPSMRVVECLSLSKAYSVPGWRVGALAGNKEAVERVRQIKAHADYGLFLPIQSAAAAALVAPDDPARLISREYKRRAQVLSNGLRRTGWAIESPSAGGCVWARLPEDLSLRLREQSLLDPCAAALEVLHQTGVLTSPGSLFGSSHQDYLRFALVAPVEQLLRAIESLEELSNGKVAA